MKIIITGHCFWTLEGVFALLKGVSDIECGHIWMKEGTPSQCTHQYPHHKMECIRFDWDEQELSAIDLTRVLLSCTSAGLVAWNDIIELSGMRSMIAQMPEEHHQKTQEVIAQISEQQNTTLHTQVIADELFFLPSVDDDNFFEDKPHDGYSCGIIAPKRKRITETLPHVIK